MDAIEQDEGFWRAAYRSHGPAVLAFLVRRLGRREEAEDVLQETFVRAIDSGTLRHTGNLRAYLMRIARNLVIDRFRRPRLVIAEERTGDDAAPREPVASASPEREAAWSGFKGKLERVVAEMNADQRTAFEMGVLQQHSYSEIARVTGWSASLVKVKVYRARRKVIDRLQGHIPDLGGRL